MLAETFFDLVTDSSHWQFEIFTTVVQDVVLLGFAVPLIKRAVRRHDEKKHAHSCEADQ